MPLIHPTYHHDVYIRSKKLNHCENAFPRLVSAIVILRGSKPCLLFLRSLIELPQLLRIIFRRHTSEKRLGKFLFIRNVAKHGQ